jgi:hypothetical protein
MRTTPTTALIAVLACATGLLIGWYAPAPLLPAVVFAVLAYALAVVGLAAAFRIDRDRALVDATRAILTLTALALQAGLRACIGGLNFLDRWAAPALHRTGAEAS